LRTRRRVISKKLKEQLEEEGRRLNEEKGEAMLKLLKAHQEKIVERFSEWFPVGLKLCISGKFGHRRYLGRRSVTRDDVFSVVAIEGWGDSRYDVVLRVKKLDRTGRVNGKSNVIWLNDVLNSHWAIVE
jgi:hypothetical protein